MYSSLCRSATTRKNRRGDEDALQPGSTQKQGIQEMQRFTLQTIESAPENSRATLQTLESKFGFIPNVMATMANSPVLLNGFVGSFGSFHSGSLDECEKQILLLTNAVTIKCPWTV